MGYLAFAGLLVGLYAWVAEQVGSASRSGGDSSATPASGASVVYYRTRDGKADYGFSFEREAGGVWRAYIVSGPPYGTRCSGLHETHRLKEGSRYYVCWTDALESEDAARQVAALWADATQEYIRTGTRF
jgi:hypothetical protein